MLLKPKLVKAWPVTDDAGKVRYNVMARADDYDTLAAHGTIDQYLIDSRTTATLKSTKVNLLRATLAHLHHHKHYIYYGINSDGGGHFTHNARHFTTMLAKDLLPVQSSSQGPNPFRMNLTATKAQVQKLFPGQTIPDVSAATYGVIKELHRRFPALLLSQLDPDHLDKNRMTTLKLLLEWRRTINPSRIYPTASQTLTRQLQSGHSGGGVGVLYQGKPFEPAPAWRCYVPSAVLLPRRCCQQYATEYLQSPSIVTVDICKS